jgi:hypothetical protein
MFKDHFGLPNKDEPLPEPVRNTMPEENTVKKKEIDCYITRITETEYWAWRDMLVNGTSLPPEAIGLLIGRARPIYKEE